MEVLQPFSQLSDNTSFQLQIPDISDLQLEGWQERFCQLCCS